MSNLYELNDEIMSLREAFETGEIPEDAFNDTLEGLHMEFETKTESLCKLRANLLADAAACDAEAKRLNERKTVYKNEVERIQSYIQSAMQAAEQKKYKAGTFSISVAKSTPAVEIYDADLVPKDYFTTPTPVVNKTAIKDAIKSGVRVPGAKLTQGEHLNIR